MPVWMVRSGRWPLRTTCCRPAWSLRWAWLSIQAATSASMASARRRRAPSRRMSVSTSWPVGNGTMRMSVVDSLMAGYSSASWAIGVLCSDRITKDTPPPFDLPYTTFGYTPCEGHPLLYDYEYERKGVCNLFLFVEPLRG